MVWCIYLSYQFPLTIKIDFWLANICQRLSFLRSFWHLSITMKHWRQNRRAFLKIPFSLLLKFIYSEKTTKFCEIFTLLLTGTIHRTKVKWIFRKTLWPSQNIWTLNEYLAHPETNSETTFFSSGHTASSKSKLRKLWWTFCAKTRTDKIKRI